MPSSATARSVTASFATVAFMFAIVLNARLPLLVYFGEASRSTLVIIASFVAALCGIALLRGRTRARLPAGLALLLGGVPFIVGLLVGETASGEWTADLTGLTRHFPQFAAWGLAEARAYGARFSLALVLAEVVMLCRFGGGRPVPHAWWIGLGLASPFQLVWLGQAHALGLEALWASALGALDLLVPVVALIAIPVSLHRGGAHTGRVLVALACASFMAVVRAGGWMAEGAFGYHGCTPASRFEIFGGVLREVVGFNFLEGFSWAPGLLALCVALMFLSKQRVIVPLGVLAVLVFADAFAVSRLGRLQVEPLTAPDFVPRGAGRKGPDTLRVSQLVVLDQAGTLLLRDPLAMQEKLGEVFRDRAQTGACWVRPFETRPLRELRVALDDRLLPSQALAIARVARRQGIDAILFVEGEQLSAPGQEYLLSAHLQRLVASSVERKMFLGRDAVPTGCKAGPVAVETRIDGSRSEPQILDL